MSTNLSSEERPKVITPKVTSYDLWKALAVILMLVDHVGVHFYPDEFWFRAIGRLCVPIWFFFIGYSTRDTVPISWWIGGFIVAISAFMSGQNFLPLNICFSLILARSLRVSIIDRAFYNAEILRGMFLVMVFSTLPTMYMFEYGALAFLFVVMGAMVREWDDVVKHIRPIYLRMFVGFSFFAYFMAQGAFVDQISVAQISLMMHGFLFISIGLMMFKPREFSVFDNIALRPFGWVLRVLGRRTLEIYVLHIVIIRAVAVYLFPDRFPFMQLKIVGHYIPLEKVLPFL